MHEPRDATRWLQLAKRKSQRRQTRNAIPPAGPLFRRRFFPPANATESRSKDVQPGFDALWHRLVQVGITDLELRFPAEIIAMRMLSESTPITFEDDVQRLAVEARRLGVKLTKNIRIALETAANYAAGAERLASVAQLAERLVRTPPHERPVGLATALMDHWYVLMDRHLQAMELLAEHCGRLSAAPEFDTRTKVIGDWVAERRAAIAKMRNYVAHPNSVWHRAIDEDGLWEPMLLLGAGDGTASEMAVQQFADDSRSLDYREQVPRQTTPVALSGADSLCEILSTLL